MKLLNKRIIDGAGKMPVGLMRTFFELAMVQSDLLTPEDLQIVNVSGQFSHYYRRPVDLAWVGFALGLRCQQRLDEHFDSIKPPPGMVIVKTGTVQQGDWFRFPTMEAWTLCPPEAIGGEIVGVLVARPFQWKTESDPRTSHSQ